MAFEYPPGYGTGSDNCDYLVKQYGDAHFMVGSDGWTADVKMSNLGGKLDNAIEEATWCIEEENFGNGDRYLVFGHVYQDTSNCNTCYRTSRLSIYDSDNGNYDGSDNVRLQFAGYFDNAEWKIVPESGFDDVYTIQNIVANKYLRDDGDVYARSSRDTGDDRWQLIKLSAIEVEISRSFYGQTYYLGIDDSSNDVVFSSTKSNSVWYLMPHEYDDDGHPVVIIQNKNKPDKNLQAESNGTADTSSNTASWERFTLIENSSNGRYMIYNEEHDVNLRYVKNTSGPYVEFNDWTSNRWFDITWLN